MTASRRSSSLFSARAWNLRVIPVSRRTFRTSNSHRRSRSSNTSGRRNRRRRPRSRRSYSARRSRDGRQRRRYCISRTLRMGSSSRASRASTCRSYSGPYNKSLGDERLRRISKKARGRARSALTRLTCHPSSSPYCIGSAGSRNRRRNRLRYARPPSGSSRRRHLSCRTSAHLRYSNAGLRRLSRLSATNYSLSARNGRRSSRRGTARFHASSTSTSARGRSSGRPPHRRNYATISKSRTM